MHGYWLWKCIHLACLFCHAHQLHLLAHNYNIIILLTSCSSYSMYRISLGCQPLHKRGRVWYHRYTHIVQMSVECGHDQSDHSVIIRIHFPT